MHYKRSPKSTDLKSFRQVSSLNIRQKIVIFATAFSLALIIISSLWIMRRGRPRIMPPTIPSVERGAIIDRNGLLLATQIENYTVSLWLPLIRNRLARESEEDRHRRIELVSHALAPIVLWPQRELYERIINHQSNTLVLLRHADVQIRNRLQAASRVNMIPGLQIFPDMSRSYPQGELAAPLIGYINVDSRGAEGLEFAFDRFLSPNTIGGDQDTVDGFSLQLTIDVNLQANTEHIMQRALRHEGADAGVAMIMDGRSGEILSYVSVPGFNPTFYGRYSPIQRMNRPIVEAFEPGSVFKIFTMAAMLEAGAIDPGERFCCPGHFEYTVGNQTFRINCVSIHGDQNIADIMANSCNSGMAYFSQRMTNQDFHRSISAFGFGRRTNVPLSGETTGLLAQPNAWSIRTRPTIAMGQEIGVSAIQIMQAATVFANDGVMIRPRIVKHLLHSNGSIYQSYEREELGRVISSEVNQNLLSQLDHTVRNGLARRMIMPDIRIGAKTGTSQTIDPVTGLYSTENYIASALAFVPADDPQYILYVVMHHPRYNTIWGSNVAAPIIRELVEVLIPDRGLPTSHTDHLVIDHMPQLLIPYYPEPSELLPNFEGRHLRQSLHFFGRDDLFYRIDGSGFIVDEQFPPAGSLLRPGMTIRLRSDDEQHQH